MMSLFSTNIIDSGIVPTGSIQTNTEIVPSGSIQTNAEIVPTGSIQTDNKARNLPDGVDLHFKMPRRPNKDNEIIMTCKNGKEIITANGEKRIIKCGGRKCQLYHTGQLPSYMVNNFITKVPLTPDTNKIVNNCIRIGCFNGIYRYESHGKQRYGICKYKHKCQVNPHMIERAKSCIDCKFGADCYNSRCTKKHPLQIGPIDCNCIFGGCAVTEQRKIAEQQRLEKERLEKERLKQQQIAEEKEKERLKQQQIAESEAKEKSKTLSITSAKSTVQDENERMQTALKEFGKYAKTIEYIDFEKWFKRLSIQSDADNEYVAWRGSIDVEGVYCLHKEAIRCGEVSADSEANTDDSKTKAEWYLRKTGKEIKTWRDFLPETNTIFVGHPPPTSGKPVYKPKPGGLSSKRQS